MKTVKQIVEECNRQVDEMHGDMSNPWNNAIHGSHVGLTFNDMPTVIIFQRKSIRTFPNNQLVGLYYAQGIDQYLSLPFNSVTGQFYMEESEQKVRVTIKENFNDNLITIRQEGALANAAGGVASEVGRRMKDYAIDTVKSGMRKARLGLGIDKLDTRTPADNLDKTRKDYGGLGTQLMNRADDFVKSKSADYLNQLSKSGTDPEPAANTVKESFSSTLYALREQGTVASPRLVKKPPPPPKPVTPDNPQDDTKTRLRNAIGDIEKRDDTAGLRAKQDAAAQAVKDAASGAVQTAKDTASGAVQTAKDKAAEAAQAVKDKAIEAAQAAKDKLKDTYKQFKDREAEVNKEVNTKLSDPKNPDLVSMGVSALDTNLFGGALGKGLTGPNASKEEQDKARGKFGEYAGIAFASKGLEAVTGWRQARAEKMLGSTDADRERRAREKETAQKPQQAQQEPASASIQRRKWEMSRPGTAGPKPPPQPAAPVSAKAVPAVKPQGRSPGIIARMKGYFREDVNLGIISNMIEHDIDMSNLIFEGEKEVSINNRIARKLWEVYSSLNNENRKEMARMINENVTSYRKILNFAMRQ